VCLPEEGGSSLRNVVNVCSVVYSVLRQREILSYLPVMCYMLLRCQEIVLHAGRSRTRRKIIEGKTFCVVGQFGSQRTDAVTRDDRKLQGIAG
jgi:hypothetical protein